MGSLSPPALLDAARGTGIVGLLVDTADKDGPGLVELVDDATLRTWVDAIHAAGFFAALAGKIRRSDLVRVLETGADIAGVRGAACTGGRTGCVSAERVRALQSVCDQATDVQTVPGSRPGV